MPAVKKSMLVTVWTEFTVYWWPVKLRQGRGVFVDISQALAAVWTYISNKQGHITKAEKRALQTFHLLATVDPCIPALFTLCSFGTNDSGVSRNAENYRSAIKKDDAGFELDCCGNKIPYIIYISISLRYVVNKWLVQISYVQIWNNKVKQQSYYKLLLEFKNSLYSGEIW